MLNRLHAQERPKACHTFAEAKGTHCEAQGARILELERSKPKTGATPTAAPDPSSVLLFLVVRPGAPVRSVLATSFF